MRTFVRATALLVAMVLTGCGATNSGIGEGNAAPDIVGVDADGKSFQLDDYRGKVVLLDFWASY
jgi:hypothetical protein